MNASHKLKLFTLLGDYPSSLPLKKGEVSSVVHTDFGYHIIQATDVKPAATQPFSEVKDTIAKDYVAQQAAKNLSEDAEGFTALVYEKSKPMLVDDNDTTGLPDGYDLALVHGGKAEGFKLSNVPLWEGFDQDFSAAATALEKDYLTGIRGQNNQLGSGRPHQWG